MKEFSVTIRDPFGIHARPAGLLSKEAQRFSSQCSLVTVDRQTGEEKETSLRRLMAVMGLGIRQGDTIKLRIEGEDEEEAAAALKIWIEHHLSEGQEMAGT